MASAIYNLEPLTKGKVVLHTTLGDIEVELWPKEAPKAVRNFAQLCMEGYYDGTVFHRVVKDFMVQGGDPTGSGTGGASIYGRPFKDEFHARLKFTHRGLVACANTNAPDTNGSQFFITLKRAEHLDRANTIFGRVAGDTIFNAIRIGDVDTDDSDRPLDPPRVTHCTVLLPPFDDIMPRTTPAEREAAAAAAAAQARATAFAARRKKGKALSKLSFGDEVEEDEGQLGAAREQLRFRSAHETLQDARLEAVAPGSHDAHVEAIRKRLVTEAQERAAEEAKEVARGDTLRAIKERSHATADAEGGRSFADAMAEKAQARSQAARGARPAEAVLPPPPSNAPAAKAPADDRTGGAEPRPDSDSEDGGEHGASKKRKVGKVTFSKPGQGAAATSARLAQVADAELMTSYQASLAQFKQRKRAKGEREADVLARLKTFTTLLKQKPSDAAAAGMAAKSAADAAMAAARVQSSAAVGSSGYDGKVNRAIDHSAYLPPAWRVDGYLDQNSEDDDFADLRGHQLTWSAHDQVADPNKRRDDVNDYTVVDPLLEAGKAAFNKAQQKAKKRQNEWAGRANL